MNKLENLKRLQEVAAAIERKELRVGYFENAVYPEKPGFPKKDGGFYEAKGEPPKVAYVAAIHELGYSGGKGKKAATIPPRPTLEPGVRDAANDMSEAVKYASKRAIDGSLDPDKVLEAAGMIAQASVRKRIQETTAPALAEFTIEMRAKRHGKGTGSTKPLVDTGFMLNNVAFAIVESGEDVEAGIHTSWDSDEQST